MSTKIYANARFGFREDTLENWMKNNPVLEKGEPAVVRDGQNGEWLKIGDGITAFNDLSWKKGPKSEKGENVVIDQTYNPSSENAQSGKAVAEAITTKANLSFEKFDGEILYISSYDEPTEELNGYYEVTSIRQIGDGIDSPFRWTYNFDHAAGCGAFFACFYGGLNVGDTVFIKAEYVGVGSYDIDTAVIKVPKDVKDKADKTAVEALSNTIGDIETALDSIIAIQEEMIGGENE